jgi:hypothetical protein
MATQEVVIEKFLEKIKTKEDLENYIEHIEELSAWIYKGGGGPISEKVKGKVNEEFRQVVITLEKTVGIPSARRAQSEFFKRVSKSLESLPSVKLTIAFLPSDEFLEKMIVWLDKQILAGPFLNMRASIEITHLVQS